MNKHETTQSLPKPTPKDPPSLRNDRPQKQTGGSNASLHNILNDRTKSGKTTSHSPHDPCPTPFREGENMCEKKTGEQKQKASQSSLSSQGITENARKAKATETSPSTNRGHESTLGDEGVSKLSPVSLWQYPPQTPEDFHDRQLPRSRSGPFPLIPLPEPHRAQP